MMKKGIWGLTILMVFLSWLPCDASKELLDPLIGKIVVIESNSWSSYIGEFTGYDAEKLYFIRTKNKWAKKLYRKYRTREYDKYKWPLRKGHSLLLKNEVDAVYLVKDGLEPELYLELEDIDPMDLPTGKADPNADLRAETPARTPVYMRTLWKVTSMKGWTNFKGKWISETNYIPLKPRDVIGKMSDSLVGLYEAKEAFDEWKIKIIRHQGKSWLALLKKKTRLSGKYSPIKALDTIRGSTWYTYWIVPRDEFLEQLRGIKDGQPNLVKAPLLLKGTWSLKDLLDGWEKLSSEFPKSGEKDHHFYINIRPFKDRKIFQTLLFEWPDPEVRKYRIYRKKEKKSSVMTEEELKDLFERATTEKLYKECYFEGEYIHFENLLKIIEMEK